MLGKQQAIRHPVGIERATTVRPSALLALAKPTDDKAINGTANSITIEGLNLVSKIIILIFEMFIIFF